MINCIKVKNNGFVYCKSGFYSAQDGLSDDNSFVFHNGINKLVGEIDSEIWAISYLLSMYKYRPEDFVLFGQGQAEVDGKTVSLEEFAEYSCYMDALYPLFSSEETVDELVFQGLKYSGIETSVEDVRNLFFIDKERMRRPLKGVGTEIFKAMTAIGYSYGKEVFCFPWQSYKRFLSYHLNLSGLLDILNKLQKVVILPVGNAL